eukprot:TRINITY_DN6746_c0_g2_i2.p1 TRINITY_DN6746_c0_g2~~TRINITY_DN6746_c0_g2_i2.p1  ORF type:complete len:434 (+),score=44.42 TRINITY_DN6746_c0_g2_i2:44-1345(+)
MASFEIELGRCTSDLVSFEENQHLLRGVLLSTILQSFGGIFSTSTGSSQTYSLSFVVDGLNAFISHNWSVARYKKVLTLCLHYNFNLAATISLVLTGVLGGLLGDLRKTSAFPVFCVLLIFIRRFLSLVGHQCPIVFLDKTCICQDDAEIQRQGILKLGAFIAKSDKMLILYTDVYLQKLWTVYEVAAFLSTRDIKDLEVVSVHYCTAVLYVFAGAFAFNLTASLEIFANKGGYMRFFFCFVFIMQRRRFRDRERVTSRLSEFRVQSCKCAVENDRPLVYRNISDLMKATNAVDENATRDEALAAFNSLVSTKLPRVFLAAGNGIAYKHVVFLTMPYVYNPAESLRSLRAALVTVPLVIIIVESCASHCLHLRPNSFLNIVWLVTSTVIAFSSQFAIEGVVHLASKIASPFATDVLAGIIGGYLIYRHRRRLS